MEGPSFNFRVVDKEDLEKKSSTISLAADEGKSESEIDQKRVLQVLEEKGFLVQDPQRGIIIDREKFKKIFFTKADHLGSEKDRISEFKKEELIHLLENIDVYIRDDVQEGEVKAEKRKFLPIPESLDELINAFPHEAYRAAFNIWDFDNGKVLWAEEIRLSDGTITNHSELYLSYILHKLRARRRKGVLEIFDDEKGSYVKFSGNRLRKMGIQNPVIGLEDKSISFIDSPSEFSSIFLKNLLKEGLLELSDFERQGGSEALDLFGGVEKEVSISTSVRSFTNKDGISAKYYTGRGRFPGTDIDTRENHTYLRQLDDTHVAIIVDRSGRKDIAYTFRLLDSVVLDKKREEVIEKMMKGGNKITSQNISAYTTVSASEMEALVEEYSITDYVPPHDGESYKSYAERIARLNNYEYVLDKFQVFLGQTSVGSAHYSWREKLLLADAVTTVKNFDKLEVFAREYGAQGLRTFLSVDQDRSLGDQILSLDEYIPPNVLNDIFATYSEILDGVEDAVSVLSSYAGQGSDESIERIRSDLMKRAKLFLDRYLHKIQNAEKEDREVITEEALEMLRRYSVEATIFASTYRELARSDENISRESLQHSIEIKSAAEITADEKKEMLEIDEDARRSDYPHKLFAYAHNHLKENLDSKDADTIYHILKHKGRIVAFMSSKELANGNTYVGSLNVRNEAKSSRIGHTMLISILDKLAQTSSVEAVALPTIPIYQKYISPFGYKFVENGEYVDFKGTGVTVKKLIRCQNQQRVAA